MKRRDIIRNSAILAGATAVAGNAMAEGTDSFGSVIIPPSQEMGKEKHVPIIDAPSSAKVGVPITVTVTVGKTVPHPNTVEHHIKGIQLYALPEGSRYVVELAKCEFGPTYTKPALTASVMLQKNSKIYALAYCNIHGVWDFSVDVKVS